MDDNDPRREPVQDPETSRRWHDMQYRNYGYMGPVIAIIAVLFLALLLFGTWSSDDQSSTQVGQNVERKATPDTPRDPNVPAPR